MILTNIYCPGGTVSQTGTAARERYCGVNIESCEDIAEARESLDVNDGPYAIPIWNSNQGEVDAAKYVWDFIEEEKIKLFDLWPKRIEFWFVTKAGERTEYGKIGSVVVAETQCANFLSQQKADLDPCRLTNIAFDRYKAGAQWDGVLVAPGQGEDELGYEVVNKETANNNNFTSFVTLTPWNSNKITMVNVSSWLTGVTMSSLGASLDDDQSAFFGSIFSDSPTFLDIPKLIFVFDRIEKVGLLFEGQSFSSGDFLDAEELERGEILVHENVGELENAYTKELEALFDSEFPDLKNNDFILHRGEKTVLFACPPLGIYTHGYEEETVVPVVRLYIDKVFEFIDNGGKCAAEQTAFFNKHKSSWEKKRSEFMKFTVV